MRWALDSVSNDWFGIDTNNTFGDGFEEGRWMAQVNIGIRNGTNNTFGGGLEMGAGRRKLLLVLGIVPIIF